MTLIEKISQQLKELPPNILVDLEDFIDVIQKQNPKYDKKTSFNLNWAGSLSDYKNRFTSLDLQKKANIWRTEKYIKNVSN